MSQMPGKQERSFLWFACRDMRAERVVDSRLRDTNTRKPLSRITVSPRLHKVQSPSARGGVEESFKVEFSRLSQVPTNVTSVELSECCFNGKRYPVANAKPSIILTNSVMITFRDPSPRIEIVLNDFHGRKPCFSLREMKEEDPFSSQLSRQIVAINRGDRFKFQPKILHSCCSTSYREDNTISVGERRKSRKEASSPRFAFKSKLESKG